MLKAFERFGSTAIPMHLALFNIPLTIALRFRIPLVVWGENSAVEYGSADRAHDGAPARRGVARDLRRDARHDGGGLGRRRTLTERDLDAYFGPDPDELESHGVRAVFLGHYFRVGLRDDLRGGAEHGFRENPGGARTGLYDYADIDDDFISLHHWMKWYKFGFTRAVRQPVARDPQRPPDARRGDRRSWASGRPDAARRHRARSARFVGIAASASSRSPRRSATPRSGPGATASGGSRTSSSPTGTGESACMCGIAGFVGRPPLSRTPDRRRPSRRMRHRGPDDALAPRLGDARRPASSSCCTRGCRIIDLDARANQPFGIGRQLDRLQRRALQLRRAARRARRGGCDRSAPRPTPRSCCGARTRAAGGCSTAARACGRSRLYDEADGALSLCRDRFGEKPLYLLPRRATGSTSAPSSSSSSRCSGAPLPVEPPTTCALPGQRLQGALQDARHLLRGARGAARRDRCCTSAPDGERALQRYWDAGAARARTSMTYDEAVAGARERLIRSVELRLRADVPLAFCMSGGVDSNALISIAKRASATTCTASPSSTPTRATRSRTWSTTRCASSACATPPIPVDTARLPAAAARAGALPRRAGLHDHLLRALAADGGDREHGYRISVSGTAADELFTGYYDHHLAYLHEVRGDRDAAAASARAWQRAHPPDRAQPVPAEPGPVRRRPGLPRSHLPRRRRLRRLPHRAVRARRSARRATPTRCCATAC